MFGLGSATVLQTRMSFNNSRAESVVSPLLYKELVNKHQKAGQKKIEKSKHVRIEQQFFSVGSRQRILP
jgi:hypothetical protein